MIRATLHSWKDEIPNVYILHLPLFSQPLSSRLLPPILHAQTKRSLLCIKSINSTCRYTAITQMEGEHRELCVL